MSNNIIVLEQENGFIVSINGEEAHEINDALSYLIINLELFEFSALQLSTKIFDANWSDDLGGYEVIFNDGSAAYTQTYKEDNKLHADYGETYIERYSEHDSELSEYQDDVVDKFVSDMNELKSHFDK